LRHRATFFNTVRQVSNRHCHTHTRTHTHARTHDDSLRPVNHILNRGTKTI